MLVVSIIILRGLKKKFVNIKTQVNELFYSFDKIIYLGPNAHLICDGNLCPREDRFTVKRIEGITVNGKHASLYLECEMCP